MTSQGTASGRFQRAIAKKQLSLALPAAHELGELSLSHALDLCLLFAEVAPERYPAAAARWHARFVLQAKGLGLDESQAALAAPALLPRDREPALRLLLELARRCDVNVGSPNSRSQHAGQ